MNDKYQGGALDTATSDVIGNGRGCLNDVLKLLLTAKYPGKCVMHQVQGRANVFESGGGEALANEILWGEIKVKRGM